MAITPSLTRLAGLLWTLRIIFLSAVNFVNCVIFQGLTQGVKYTRTDLSPIEIGPNAYTDSYLPIEVKLVNSFFSVKLACNLVAFSFVIFILMHLIAQGAVEWSASTIWLGIIRRNRYLGIAKEQAPSRVLPADPPPASPISFLSQCYK